MESDLSDEEYEDGTVRVVKKRKVEKRAQKYKFQWEADFPWLKKDETNDFNAKCTACGVVMVIGTGGVGQDTLISEFSDCGKILRCRLVKDIVTGKSKQYAFIEFERNSDVDRALQKHKEYIDNTEVIIEREVGRVMKGWKPRRLGGGFGGNKNSGQLRFGCRDRPFKRPIKIGEDRRD